MHNAPMAIHMGIRCEACRRVYFIGTSNRIQPSLTATMYRLICILPCLGRKEFRVDAMRPYRVDENVFKTGFAIEGEYEAVQAAKLPPRSRR